MSEKDANTVLDMGPDDYGRRVPTHRDIEALATLVKLFEPVSAKDELHPIWESITLVVLSYCSQFRDVRSEP